MACLLSLRVSFEGDSPLKNLETSFSSPSCLSEGFDRMLSSQSKSFPQIISSSGRFSQPGRAPLLNLTPSHARKAPLHGRNDPLHLEILAHFRRAASWLLFPQFVNDRTAYSDSHYPLLASRRVNDERQNVREACALNSDAISFYRRLTSSPIAVPAYGLEDSIHIKP